MQLKKQLKQRKAEIEEQKKLHNTEMEKQKGLLEKCLRGKQSWKEKSEQNVQEQVGDTLNFLMRRNTELSDENEKLKTQIEQLKKEIKLLEAQIGPKPLESEVN